MHPDENESMIKDFIVEYQRYKTIAEKAMAQVSEADLNRVVSPDNNSIAMIMRHISGNFLSRFTDFLTSDGEKPWRNRDSEFEDGNYDPAELRQMWDEGWSVLTSELSKLGNEHFEQKVYIRGEAWTVMRRYADRLRTFHITWGR